MHYSYNTITITPTITIKYRLNHKKQPLPNTGITRRGKASSGVDTTTTAYARAPHVEKTGTLKSNTGDSRWAHVPNNSKYAEACYMVLWSFEGGE